MVKKQCKYNISTHTLRGERDLRHSVNVDCVVGFQLTRSVGSVTDVDSDDCTDVLSISTHTLRGERD